MCMRGMGEIWGVKGGDGHGGLWENLLTQPSSSNYMGSIRPTGEQGGQRACIPCAGGELLTLHLILMELIILYLGRVHYVENGKSF